MKSELGLIGRIALVLSGLLAIAPKEPLRAEMKLAYIVGDTTALGLDTLFVNRLETRLGYQVVIMDDNAVDTFSSWSVSYNGIIISDLALAGEVVCLRDTAVGLFTMDRYTETEFGLGTTNYRPSGHGRRLVNTHNCEFICEVFRDTIFPYQYDNRYFYYYGGLSDSALCPFNTPDFVGHDTSCLILLDKNTLLAGGGRATERRVFAGVFRDPNLMDYCLSWELFDRIAAWICRDTANPVLAEYTCWGSHLEIDACWGEFLSSTNDSATFNSELRFGYDYDEMLSFWRLIEPDKKATAGYVCDSLLLLFPIFALGLNGAPEDTVMDIKISAYRIIKDEKWHGPPANGGGDPYDLDSTWVTRWDVIAGPTPVPWDTVDLAPGSDYDPTPLDTFRLNYPADSIGDIIRFKIPGQVLNGWVNDPSGNNGLVFKVTAVYDSSSNIEYSTRPPYENALSSPMKAEAWWRPGLEGRNLIWNIIGTGLIDLTDDELE